MKRNQGAITGGHARPSAPLTLAEIFRHKYLGGGDFTINFLAISCDSKHFLFCFTEKKNSKINPPGGRGVPQFFFYPKSYFCDLKSRATFRSPMMTPSGRIVFLLYVLSP